MEYATGSTTHQSDSYRYCTGCRTTKMGTKNYVYTGRNRPTNMAVSLCGTCKAAKELKYSLDQVDRRGQ